MLRWFWIDLFTFVFMFPLMFVIRKLPNKFQDANF